MKDTWTRYRKATGMARKNYLQYLLGGAKLYAPSGTKATQPTGENNMYEDTIFMKGSTRNHEAARCGKPYKFFVICPIDTSGFSIAAMLPNTEKVAIFLKDTLCCPLAQSITDSAFEELIALQANNGLTLEDPTGAKVWVVKSNSVEMVGRKVAKLLLDL